MPGIKITPWTGQDVSLSLQLAGLHALAFGAEAWSESQISGSLALDTTRLWLTHEAGLLVGFLLAQEDTESLEVLTFCVHPDQRGKGLGESLLRAALATAPKGGSFLEVAADNLVAKRLYERCGYKRIGTRKNYYKHKGAVVDALCYRWQQD